ncbi:MAG TPA: LysR family transcriptional regulator [Alphaproteobacteria bacterium]|nr:LysR family transcriptional regulator [Alphaproteobacteria bacterium]
MLDWDDLRFFIGAVRAGNYTAAAERLRVNRTTVGRRIGSLETALGISLFEQSPSGYRPTTAGRAVLECAERIEREMEQLVKRLAATEERVTGTVRVAISGEIGTEFMPELLAFRKTAPEIKLELLTARDAINMLLQRKADLGLCLVPYKPEHLRGIRVGLLEQALYAARDYADRRALAEREWIGWGKDMTHSAAARWMKTNLPDTARISAEVNSWDAFKEAVLCGLGVGHMWCFVAEREPGLMRIRDSEPDLAMELWLLVREDVPPDAHTNALMSFLAPALAQRIGGAT